MQRQTELLRRLERQYIRRRVVAMGLQPIEGHMLHLLDLCGELRQEDIAHKFGIDKGSVARAAAHLEELGLVRRQVSDQCRREKLVALTEEGQAMAARIQQVMDDWEEIGYQGFTPEERALYEGFLMRIAQNAVEFKRREGEHNG